VAVKVRVIAGIPSLVANLDFKDMLNPEGQTLSIIVTDLLNKLISDAAINANITLPNGTIVNATFSEMSLGNYTFFYNFTDIGDYVIKVHISKSGFPNPISGEKTVTVGLVRFIDFTSDPEIVQGGTMHFRFSAKNMGNASSTIVPSFRIYDSGGNLVFSKEGFATVLEPNTTASLIQFNVMTWPVGPAALGTYTASGNILFTDTGNISVYTANKTITFRVVAPPVPLPVGVSGFIGPTVTKKPPVPPLPPLLKPLPEFVFVNLPVLVEAYPTDLIVVPVTVTNPFNETISNITISVRGLPNRWYSVSSDLIELKPNDIKTVPIKFTIPKNAETGNHLSHIVIGNDEIGKETSFILRINQPTDQYPVLLYESADVNEIENITAVTIRVRNKQNSIKAVHIIVRIDKLLARNLQDVVFVTNPYRTVEPDSAVEFKLDDLAPEEERNITYFVRKVVPDTAPFVYSSIEQVYFIEVKKIEVPAAVVEIRFVYLLILLILVIIIIIIMVVYAHQRRKTREALREAKHAVRRIVHK